MADAHRFWAFISYSHSDAQTADWLQRALEGYAVPRRFVGGETGVGPAPRHFKPVFRDREDLAANPDLRASVQAALAESAFLIVICSPEAARSPWVEDEIVEFKRRHGEGRVLSLIVGGEPFASREPGREAEECFPAGLRSRLGPDGTPSGEPAEPVAADLRKGGDGRRDALLKLVAGMLGVGLDALVRRDAQRRMAQLATLTAIAGAAVVAMAALTATALAERDTANRQRAQAEGLIEFMLGDLKDRLEPAGRLDALDAVGRRAMAYYAAQKSSDLDADALGRRARALHLMGDLREQRGDFAGATAMFDQAARSTAELVARAPNDPQRIYDHAQSVYWLGEAAQRRGDLGDAERQFGAYEQLARRLVAVDPRNPRSNTELAYAETALGVVRLGERHAAEAAAEFRRALAIFQALAARSPGEASRRYDVAQARAWMAEADLALGDATGALGERLAERAIYAAILAAAPDDKRAAFSLAVNRKKVAALYLAAGKPALAAKELDAAAAAAALLRRDDPDRVDYRELGRDVEALRAQMAAR